MLLDNLLSIDNIEIFQRFSVNLLTGDIEGNIYSFFKKISITIYSFGFCGAIFKFTIFFHNCYYCTTISTMEFFIIPSAFLVWRAFIIIPCTDLWCMFFMFFNSFVSFFIFTKYHDVKCFWKTKDVSFQRHTPRHDFGLGKKLILINFW